MIRIGIVGQAGSEKFGVNNAYLSLIESVGGTPLIIPPVVAEDFHKAFPVDVMLLPGGADVDNSRYAGIPSFVQGFSNPFLEYFDRQILPLIVEQGISIFGVCRGLQTLNVHFGGTLQNLVSHPYSGSRTELVHDVILSGNRKFKVNSMHHQAIKTLAGNFSVLATSDKDNLIEAIYDRERRIAAVQWHPEEIFDNFSLELFDTIL